LNPLSIASDNDIERLLVTVDFSLFFSAAEAAHRPRKSDRSIRCFEVSDLAPYFVTGIGVSPMICARSSDMSPTLLFALISGVSEDDKEVIESLSVFV
jgi:hypothetical protein